MFKIFLLSIFIMGCSHNLGVSEKNTRNVASVYTDSAKKKDIEKYLVPGESESATWVSECKFSMRGFLKVYDNQRFEMKLKVYSGSKCREDSNYLTLERRGSYEHKEAKFATYVDEYSGGGYSYTYQVSPAQLELSLSPIKVESEGIRGALAKGFLSMYDGCIGTSSEVDKSAKCIGSGISKRESRIRLKNINFITPTKMLGEFRNNVNVEFTLKKTK